MDRNHKSIWLDMDGTIVDLYKVDKWLPQLRSESTKPFEEAKAAVNLKALARQLNALRAKGWTINVISWTARHASTTYAEATKVAKLRWLAEHLPSVTFDRIWIVEYNTPKHALAEGGILFDDELENRKRWVACGGRAYPPELMSQTLSRLNHGLRLGWGGK